MLQLFIYLLICVLYFLYIYYCLIKLVTSYISLIYFSVFFITLRYCLVLSEILLKNNNHFLNCVKDQKVILIFSNISPKLCPDVMFHKTVSCRFVPLNLQTAHNIKTNWTKSYVKLFCPFSTNCTFNVLSFFLSLLPKRRSKLELGCVRVSSLFPPPTQLFCSERNKFGRSKFPTMHL